MCGVLRDSARRPRRELFNADMLTVYHIPSDPGEAAPLSHEAVGANRMRLLREMLAAQACRNETHWAPYALPPAPCGDPAVLNALRQTRRPDLRGFKNPAAVSGSFLQGVRQWLYERLPVGPSAPSDVSLVSSSTAPPNPRCLRQQP